MPKIEWKLGNYWLTLGNQEPSVLFGMRGSEAHVHSSIPDRQYNYLVVNEFLKFPNPGVDIIIWSRSQDVRTSNDQ